MQFFEHLLCMSHRTLVSLFMNWLFVCVHKGPRMKKSPLLLLGKLCIYFRLSKSHTFTTIYTVNSRNQCKKKTKMKRKRNPNQQEAIFVPLATTVIFRPDCELHRRSAGFCFCYSIQIQMYIQNLHVDVDLDPELESRST